MSHLPSPMPAFDSLVVLDFEATCREGEPPLPQEIIELPSVRLSLSERRVIDETWTFVRPIHHPVLTDFCTSLTGIRQEDVDSAPTFPDAFAEHQAWLAERELLGPGGEPRFAFLTCGDWDLRSMLPRQCAVSGLPVPRAYRRWVNVKTVFAKTLGLARAPGMPGMLEALGLPLEGRHHRGIDDCRNTARIVLALAARGASFSTTSRLSPGHFPALPLVLRHRGEERAIVLKKRARTALLGMAGSTFRTKIVALFTATGAPLEDDEALAELLPGDVVEAHGPAPR